MFKTLRNAFFTGIILLLPIGVTTIVAFLLIEKIGTPTRELFFFFLDPALRQAPWVDPILSLLSLLAVVIIITLLGIISKYFFGKFLVRIAESAVNAVPFIGTVYRTVKQIVDTFSQEHKAVFKQVVLFEYPRKGIWSLGFLTSTAKGEAQEKTANEVLNIFLPTTPNPTSGYLLMIPKQDVIFMDMSIGDGMKLIISGGAVTPPSQKELEDTESTREQD